MGFIAMAVITDLSVKRVPNELTVLGIITGIYLSLSEYGPWGGLELLKNIIASFIVLYFFYLLGALGAGDVKLMISLSTIIGYEAILSIIVISFLVAGLYGLCNLIKNRQLIYKCKRFMNHIFICLSKKQLFAYDPKDKEETEIHFTVCIFCAYIVWILKEGVM